MSLLLAIALVMEAASPGHAITEDQAIDRVVPNAMRYLYPNEPLQCFSFMVEDSSPKTFDIVVRETHKRDCGGDPDVMPVRDRFRVGRLPLNLWRYDPVEDMYLRCNLAHGRTTCPRLSYE